MPVVFPYRQGSNSAKALAEALGIKQLKLEGSKFKGGADKIVVNWGSSNTTQEVEKCKVINNPAAVKIASDKLEFFKAMDGKVSIPPFTTDKAKAEEWVRAGKTVVVRETLKGSGGDGIVLLDSIVRFEDYNHARAKLYTQYVPKKSEWRIHVADNEVKDVQRKALASHMNPNNADFRIRNHNFGFNFVRGDNNTCPGSVKAEALKSVAILGLDFGAVDVIFNEHRDKAYVLEINTAPGLEGQTVDTYKESIYGLVKKRKAMTDNDWLVHNEQIIRQLIQGNNPFDMPIAHHDIEELDPEF